MLKHVDDVNRISEAKIMLSENTYIKEALDEKSTMYHSINDYSICPGAKMLIQV